MSILINENTRVLVQGATGRDGSFHTARMREDGSNVVAGVTPGKGGTSLDGLPIFNTVSEAREATGADASVIFVPAKFAAGAVERSLGSGNAHHCLHHRGCTGSGYDGDLPHRTRAGGRY